MRLTPIATVAALAASPLAVRGQSLSGLPVCVQTAALSSVDSTGCGVADVSCICHSAPYIDTLQQYVEAHCDAADQQAALAFANQICAPYGVVFPAASPRSDDDAATTGLASITAPTSNAVVAYSGTATSTLPPPPTASVITMSSVPMTTMTLGSNRTATSPTLKPYVGGGGGGGGEGGAAGRVAGRDILAATLIALGAFVVAL